MWHKALEQFSFPPKKRLLTKDDFSEVFRTGKRFRTGILSIHCRENSLKHARLGIVVAKKNIPLAVVRNKIKRIVRESFRQNTQLAGLDIVVVGYKPLKTLAPEALRERLEEQWIQLQNWRKH